MKRARVTENIHCVYCNSKSHITIRCNSNMKGRRQILMDIGMNFMLDDNVPDFKSFPINELRFIASIYEDFQKQPKMSTMYRMYQYFNRRCLVTHLYSPIKFTTLTKSRIITELKLRWTIYTQVRINKNHKKPEYDDCPICMDCISEAEWNPTYLNWETKAGNNMVRTTCGHEFCGGCWGMHITANSKPEDNNPYWMVDLTRPRLMYICCPMCRTKMNFSK